MSKKIIRLTESDLHSIVKESVHRILANEGWLFGKKSKKPNELVDKKPQKHIYSEKEMQDLYDNQDRLSPLEKKVLDGGMWVRAMQANYNGYTKRWPNIILDNGEIFYYNRDGKIRKVGT